VARGCRDSTLGDYSVESSLYVSNPTEERSAPTHFGPIVDLSKSLTTRKLSNASHHISKSSDFGSKGQRKPIVELILALSGVVGAGFLFVGLGLGGGGAVFKDFFFLSFGGGGGGAALAGTGNKSGFSI